MSKIFDIIEDIEKFHNMKLPIHGPIPFLEYKTKIPKNITGLYHLYNTKTGEELYSGKGKIHDRQIPHYGKAYQLIESTAGWKNYLDNNGYKNADDWVIYYIEVPGEVTMDSIEGNLKFKLKGLMNIETFKDSQEAIWI